MISNLNRKLFEEALFHRVNKIYLLAAQLLVESKAKHLHP
jgi:hypothetical protein